MTTTPAPIRLALADDHQLFRKGLCLLFEAHPEFEVTVEAVNGLDLLASLANQPVDVVLLDLEMPELNGVETLQRLRVEFPDTKVLLLTMHDNEKYMLHCLKAGAQGYLLKDATPEELIFGVKKVHATGKYISDRVSDVLINRLEGLKTDTPDLADKFQLGQRELEVLQLICEEFTTSEIAEKLFLSVRTIESYRKRLLEKTNTRNSAGLVRFAVENSLI